MDPLSAITHSFTPCCLGDFEALVPAVPVTGRCALEYFLRAVNEIRVIYPARPGCAAVEREVSVEAHARLRCIIITNIAAASVEVIAICAAVRHARDLRVAERPPPAAGVEEIGEAHRRVDVEVSRGVGRLADLHLGPGRCCFPRHVMPLHSRNQGLKCGG